LRCGDGVRLEVLLFCLFFLSSASVVYFASTAIFNNCKVFKSYLFLLRNTRIVTRWQALNTELP